MRLKSWADEHTRSHGIVCDQDARHLHLLRLATTAASKKLIRFRKGVIVHLPHRLGDRFDFPYLVIGTAMDGELLKLVISLPGDDVAFVRAEHGLTRICPEEMDELLEAMEKELRQQKRLHLVKL